MSEGYIQYPWLFKGAYAIYEGKTKLAGRPVEATARIEVKDVDIAKGRVRIGAHSIMFWRVLFGRKKLGEKEVVDWVKIGERVILSEEAILDGEYEGTVRVERLGIRKCIVQQYSEGLNTTVVFWDKEFNWPLKYVLIFRYKHQSSDEIFAIFKGMLELATGGLLQAELKKSKNKTLRERTLILHLKETNIPGLK